MFGASQFVLTVLDSGNMCYITCDVSARKGGT